MSLSPEEQSAIRQQAGGLRQPPRADSTKVALVLCGVMLLLRFMYRGAQDQTCRSFLVFLIVVLLALAVVCLFPKKPAPSQISRAAHQPGGTGDERDRYRKVGQPDSGSPVKGRRCTTWNFAFA
jgi:hypothetical protein